MKNKSCPIKDVCWHYRASNCVGCAVGEKIARLAHQNKKLKAENAALRATLSKMETVEKELRARLAKAVELPVNVEDIVYCIRNCGTGRYRVGEYTVIEIVFKYDNQMRIKTSYGLFGCEEWTFGLDCFADRSEAEARLKEIKGE